MSRCAFRPKSLTHPGGATFLDPDLKVSEAELNRKQNQWASREQDRKSDSPHNKEVVQSAHKEEAAQPDSTGDASSLKSSWLKTVKDRLKR
ncbi:unnamed protein product [Sympodiomycopsis kandeliae]